MQFYYNSKFLFFSMSQSQERGAPSYSSIQLYIAIFMTVSYSSVVLVQTIFSKLSPTIASVSGPLLVCLLCISPGGYKRLNTQRGSAHVHSRGEEYQEQWRKTGADGIQASMYPMASDGGEYQGHIFL